MTDSIANSLSNLVLHNTEIKVYTNGYTDEQISVLLDLPLELKMVFSDVNICLY